MSTHAIVWFNDEDILSQDTPEAVAAPSGERRWERNKIDVRIRVGYKVGAATEMVDGQGNDISEGGMATYIPADLAPDDEVQVEIVRRYGQPRIIFCAKVNNRNGFRYGLEFVGVEDEQRGVLVNAVTGTQQ